MNQSVPSWSDLLRDATKLANNQRKCSTDVHFLLEFSRDLDRKIQTLASDKYEPNIRPNSRQIITPEPVRQNHFTSTPKEKPKSRPPQNKQETTKPKQVKKRTKTVTISSDPVEEINSTTNNNQFDEVLETIHVQEYNSIKETRKDSPSELEHLKPLAMPLAEYFKINRPELVARSSQRAQHLKQKAEKRRVYENAKLADSLAQLRLSKKNKNKPQKITNDINPDKDYTFIVHDQAPRYNFTEREMRQQTYKRYRSLPEVKKKVSEEIRDHMKKQNYKNKLTYAKKLMENRRHGIINYPLIATSDDVSISSGQEDFSSGDYAKVSLDHCHNAYSMI